MKLYGEIIKYLLYNVCSFIKIHTFASALKKAGKIADVAQLARARDL